MTDNNKSKKGEQNKYKKLFAKFRKLQLVLFPFWVFEAVMGIRLISGLIKLNILANWQMALIIVVVVTFILFTGWKIVNSKTRKAVRIAFVALAFILGAFYCYGCHYLSSAISFIESATGKHVETETYSVYVLKNGGYKELKNLERQTVGYIGVNPHRADTEAQLQASVGHKTADFENVGEIVAALYDSKVAAIVLNESYLDILADTDLDFEERTKVLYSFEVRSDTPDEPAKVDVKTEPFIMYISGTDSRSGLNTVARSDVNMLAVVNPQKHKILLVSIPRDYYVQLHGTTGTKDKLTHAGVYGVEMSRKTIEDLFDIDINYTTKVSFSTVISVVDTLGGIEINSDQEFTAWTNKSCHFVKGKQTVNSDCALAYSRERYAYESGDRHRIQNQQDVVVAILDKLSDPHYLSKYPKILQNAEGSFDTSMSYDEITSFAKLQLSTLQGWEVERISVDGSGAMLPTYSMGAQKLYVMIPDENTVNAAKAKIDEFMSVE